MTTVSGSHVSAHGESMLSVPVTLRRANLADSEFAYEVENVSFK